MSGDANRRGLIFQDRYLLWRLLREAGAELERRFAEPPLPPADPTRFGVEACPNQQRTPGAAGTAWDVVVESPERLEIIEVKSGVISRADREAFWRRLRSEMSSNQSSGKPLVPKLVADPHRARGLKRWLRMKSMAASARTKLPRALPPNGGSPKNLLEEALWHLCVDRSARAPAISRAAALAAIARTEVEPHPAVDLERAVARGIELLFTDGLPEQVEDMIQGLLDRRATSPDRGRQFMTVQDLFREMRQFDAASRLAPGSLENWRSLWRELPLLFDRRAQIGLGQDGASLDATRTQPAAISLFVGHGGYLLKGQAGTGKTAFLRQLAEQESEAGAEVFRVAAETVTNTGELQELFASLRFRRALTALQTPDRDFWLGVDGLDEVNDGEFRRQWALGLERFTLGERTTVVASVRSSAWQEHDALHAPLSRFTILPIEDWPDDLVQESLASLPNVGQPSPGLLELLRRALFLDLFLRTFADPEPGLPPIIGNRHDLLNEFWKRRVLGSKRPRPDDFPARLEEVLRTAAGSVGGFESSSLEQRTVALLVSEGVLVAEGGRAYRHRFRHPLLRDHALAFWCLGESGSSRVVERWQSIRGHLQSQGALRAILETLHTAGAARDYPSVQLEGVATTLAGEPDFARSLARQLGTMPPTFSMDPATWPARVQAVLPREFGRELVVAARAQINGAWAEAIQHWRPDAPWLDDEFLEALCGYTEMLFQFSNRRVLRGGEERDGEELTALRHARLAAGKLRSLVGHGHFAAVLVHNRHYLLASALEIVINLDPGDETFEVVEAELPVATHFTSNKILEGLSSLAAHDSPRAALVFKRVVGLETGNGAPTLDPARWQPSLLAHTAIDGVLGGKTGKPSVLAEHPREFMPVALELAEALSAMDYPLSAGHTLWDALLHWYNFWSRDHRHRSLDLCLWAIRRASGQIVIHDPAFFLREIAPQLQRSPSTSVQSIYLDVLLDGPGDADYLQALGACLLDAGYYQRPLLLYWLEEALRRCWGTLDEAARSRVLTLIDGMASGPIPNPSADFRRTQLLATVPAHDLTDPRLREIAAARAADYCPTPHPREGPPVVHLQNSSDGDDDPDNWRVAEWPADFSEDTLRVLSLGHRSISVRGVPAETVREHLPRMIAAAETLAATLENVPDALEHPRHLWMWEALTRCMEKHYADRFGTPTPPRALIEACVRLAMNTLEGDLPASENDQTYFSSFSIMETPWGKALHLADAALIWPSAQADESIQRRFEQVWRHAFADGAPAVQAAISREVSDYHWVRDEARRRLDDELVWTPSRHAVVLAGSVGRLYRMDGERQKRLVRRMLGRPLIGDGGNELAEALGRWLGQEAMDVRRHDAQPPVASIVGEIANDPQRRPMLAAPEPRRVFIHYLMWGMRHVASQHWRHASLLAADYGRWNLALWRAMRTMASSENEVREAASLPLAWISKNSPVVQANPPPVPPTPAAMKIWWQELQPLCRAIVEMGIEEDVYYLLYDLRPGQMDHVLKADEVLGWLTILLRRLERGLGDGTMSLNPPADVTRYQSWRENLRYAVQALDTLRADELLLSEQHWDSAYDLLQRMASPPFKLDLAMHAMPRFRGI